MEVRRREVRPREVNPVETEAGIDEELQNTLAWSSRTEERHTDASGLYILMMKQCVTEHNKLIS